MGNEKIYTQAEVDKLVNQARYDELYRYAILTYDATGRIAKERLAELKEQSGE